VKEFILTSMVKRVDVSVYDFVQSVANGSFKAGTKTYDVTNDGIGYATSGGRVDDIKAKLDAYKAATPVAGGEPGPLCDGAPWPARRSRSAGRPAVAGRPGKA
jgi:hypothetical protein